MVNQKDLINANITPKILYKNKDKSIFDKKSDIKVVFYKILFNRLIINKFIFKFSKNFYLTTNMHAMLNL